MISPATSSAGLALVSALAWGGGDFAGGMGVKAVGGSPRGALRLVVAAHGASLPVLLAVLALGPPARFALAPTLWGLGAGVAGGLSLTAFYIALARGAMGASAAISGLLAAAIPAVISTFVDGAPGAGRLLGFVIAGLAIWMIAAGAAPEAQVPTDSDMQRKLWNLWLAIGAGVGFGLYFVALRFANGLGVLAPMALARTGSITTCLLLLATLPAARAASSEAANSADPANASTPASAWIGRRAWLWALGVALLDTGANLLFVAATRHGRLDVAAVLASLYPASTIVLAAFLLKERPGRRQLLGMGVAVAAVVLITV